MINVLNKKLENARADRAKAVAPYDARIKKLSSAIKNLVEFDSISTKLNNTAKMEVDGVPTINETVEIPKGF